VASALIWVLLTGLSLLAASGVAAEPLQDVRVRWDAHAGAPASALPSESAPPATDLFSLLERRHVSGLMPRERNPELSANHVMVVTVDAAGEAIDSFLLHDPRLIRAETPGPTGELSGQVLYRTSAEFNVTLPDNPAISAVRFYKPRWAGRGWVLDLLGTLPLR